jgi:transposase
MDMSPAFVRAAKEMISLAESKIVHDKFHIMKMANDAVDKELLRDLWAQETGGKAKSYFRDWYQRVIRTKIEPMKKLARSLKERSDNIVNCCTHGITNAVAEGINSKIMLIKRREGCYRNIENFKTAVLFYCGGLDLDPR